MKKQQERRSGRKWRVALVAAALGLALAGCSASAASSHEHEWEAATCETPRVCKTCGETDGEPLGHTWQEATCLAPKTCTVCGKTEGRKSEDHVWGEATCTEREKCVLCGRENLHSEPLGHDWIAPTLEAPYTCARCGEQQGEPLQLSSFNRGRYNKWKENPTKEQYVGMSGYVAVTHCSYVYSTKDNPYENKVACKAIKAAGYATDPGYPQKLIGLIEKYGLTVYDGKAEQEDKTSMNISITKKTSTHNTTAAAGRAIRYIVVHYTAGVTSKPGSAAGTASYFGSTSKQVSADFIVDDGGAVQYNGDIRNRYTWHCGGGKYNTKGGAYYGKATNRNTIGIEVCSTNDTGKMTVANDSHWRFTDKVVSNLVELVKYLMAEYGIDAAHVIRHYDVNGKPCPGIIGWNEDTGSAAKWAAFKARLGAATPGGQTGGSTNTGTATGNTALTYKVGDIVQFAGGKHYANSQATSGTTVKPGQAKVTAVAPAGKHPYHIVHTDSASTVYGWVDAAAITGKASATPAAKTYTAKAGDSLWRIAAQQLGNGARYKEIKTMNGLKNNTIHAGQVLKLPN
mgnify:FL=1